MTVSVPLNLVNNLLLPSQIVIMVLPLRHIIGIWINDAISSSIFKYFSNTRNWQEWKFGRGRIDQHFPILILGQQQANTSEISFQNWKMTPVNWDWFVGNEEGWLRKLLLIASHYSFQCDACWVFNWNKKVVFLYLINIKGIATNLLNELTIPLSSI